MTSSSRINRLVNVSRIVSEQRHTRAARGIHHGVQQLACAGLHQCSMLLALQCGNTGG